MSYLFRFSSCQSQSGGSQPRAGTEEFKKTLSKPASPARGVAVLGHHRRCAEPGLEGLYVRGSRAVARQLGRRDRREMELLDQACSEWLSPPPASPDRPESNR